MPFAAGAKQLTSLGEQVNSLHDQLFEDKHTELQLTASNQITTRQLTAECVTFTRIMFYNVLLMLPTLFTQRLC